jgi:hypothetical protein
LATYSKLYYESRLKADFDAIWAKAKATTPSNARVSMSQDYVHSRWVDETAEFKASVEMEGARIHEEAVKAWKAKREIPVSSAEEYHK